MRLLHLTWDSPDNPWCGGGGAFRDYRILEGLGRWSPTVCSGRHPRGSLAPAGCVRIDRGVGFLGEFVSRRTWAPRAGALLRQELATPGTVASQSVSAWAPVWESLSHRDRILHVVHHVAGEQILARLGPLGPSSLRYENRILAEGRWFATPNQATAARIRDVNPGAIVEVVPNGFTPPGNALPPRRHFPGPTIAFLGRLDHRMKGLDRLLEAFAELAGKRPDAGLVLAGRSDASMDAWIESQLRIHPHRDRIAVVRNPSDLEKYAVLDGADVFCVPSRFEGWCIAAIEAQSRGLPVVATRTDGTSDSVQDGSTGILVSNREPEAPHALAQALGELLDHPDRRAALGEAARTWAMRFTWDAAVAQTDALLGRMAGDLR